jgi:hypothetical protein
MRRGAVSVIRALWVRVTEMNEIIVANDDFAPSTTSLTNLIRS